MRKATHRLIAYAGILAISFLGLVLVPIPSFAAPLPTCTGTSFMGIFVTPPPPGSSPGTWTQSIDSVVVLGQRGPLVLGKFVGTFTSSIPPPTGFSGTVNGFWSLNTATGNLLMKAFGSFFYIDYAFLDLPSVGSSFIFQGVLHIVGQPPIAMATNPVAPIKCT